MEYQKLTLAFIFCLISVTSVFACGKDDDENKFNVTCYDNSVVVTYKQQPEHEVTMYTLVTSSESEDIEKKCTRTFTENEPAVREFKFSTCGNGHTKFRVYASDKCPRTVTRRYVEVDCDRTDADLGLLLSTMLIKSFNKKS
ncbi:uncharacterized protein LOC130673113 [Microplitis mediator]|uniref:uncharacterized protein LOC130673113 n=1 Tax=Microplitis mediator TaxID=375433 RepID=UPI0025526D14|nr:uncharacterized protein LOC130673113 [Microplitis mediator]